METKDLIDSFDPYELASRKEGQTFERKSARKKPKDIAPTIIAFANTDGGVLAIGIEDDSTLSGTSFQGAYTLDDYKAAINSNIKDLPNLGFHTIPFKGKGLEDKTDYIYVITVELSRKRVVADVSGKVFLRIGDKSLVQSPAQVQRLQYAKGERLYEDKIIDEASIKDLDTELLNRYKKHNKAEQLSDEQVLSARGFIRDGHLTASAILMFGNNPFIYLPQCRLRFLRYEGGTKETGARMNLVKDINIEGALPHMIREAEQVIKSQLREFQFLGEDGRFKIVPEYPEFAWLEGVVNALVHRDYSITGDYIRVSMYDDRLEIFSPGALPDIVTIKNMRYTRFARNPRIARALSEFGWVRELNEGVNRIYDEMNQFFLKDPIYSEPNRHSVQLKLENNYVLRHQRINEKIDELQGQLSSDAFSPNERKILAYLYSNESINVQKASELIAMSAPSARKILRELLKKEAVQWFGNSARDPKQFYTWPSR